VAERLSNQTYSSIVPRCAESPDATGLNNIDEHSESARHRHMMRIMLVDDEESYRLLIRARVEKHPEFEIVGEALNGAHAITLAGELNPDLILMDISMPEMNGLEATRQIKRLLPNTTVIIVSGLDSGDEVAAERTAELIRLSSLWTNS